ncbi:carbonic anhydrase [Coccomyxa subellipsoidea C-169]|uniref:Carbonic anhydrase n=1 Tax=Coccomyxa subellipsoidea (strain C-169) TaxID=574566 RepID=I0YQ41_COCSC|nr:carbonic anhydrase [Coccomyxa subellipsoidea C-169]EIE20510.1 carbonic anhydrase [Coccomyxa subellipsoidea C-169]|eukprot:XP_005645054.1 carbonic anhydrase [Coccomyxa subellipsoidea C-169]
MRMFSPHIWSIALLLLVLNRGLVIAQSTASSSTGAPYLQDSGGDAPPAPTGRRSSTLADAQSEPKGKTVCPKLSVDRSELERGFTYLEGGLDWDNSTWSCTSGVLQSPINFPSLESNISYGQVVPQKAATFTLGTANISLVRTTSAYRVQVEADWSGTNVSIPVCGGNVGCFNKNQSVPAEFYNATIQKIHFHIPSDHFIYGVQYPLEAQVIMTISQDDLSTCPSKGCQIGLGVLFTLFDDAEKINPFLDSIIPYIPYSGAGCIGLPTTVTLDGADLLPSNTSYFTYRGSFTAPPCTEGLTWYVLATPMKVGQQQVIAFQNAMAQIQRPCGEGRISKASKKKADSGKRHLLQSSKSNNNNNNDNIDTSSNDAVCVVTGTRSNNRPVQPLGTRIVNFFRDDTNGTDAAST